MPRVQSKGGVGSRQNSSHFTSHRPSRLLAAEEDRTEIDVDDEDYLIRPQGLRARVYFAQAPNGDVKIGCSADPEKRVRNLGYSIGHKLTLLGHVEGDYRTEAIIHHRFRRHLVSGREWFSDEIVPDVVRLLGHAYQL